MLVLMKRHVLAFLVLATAASPLTAEEKLLAPAVQREEQLDVLFGRLRLAGAGEQKAIEQKIWEVWARPVSATAEVLLQEASTALAAREYDAAEAILNELTASYPEFSEGWNRRATMYFVQEKYDLSLRDIEKVLDLEPRHFGALAGRGMIYQRQEKWGPALDAYRRALRLNPGMQGVKDAIKELEKVERDT
jgi:tetratricopeptide (TPR) repeat protein